MNTNLKNSIITFYLGLFAFLIYVHWCSFFFIFIRIDPLNPLNPRSYFFSLSY